ncbi:hypothetical protein AMAG_01201 [Allomyces macrogynus ATCC 38327]|uniref:BAR domain-containing protein n=1 Tax=Allomyces macrogynus (strain ATCC 38327) TaxID=578462 RepID=A0A0L0RYY8_ALLM3|nr:hypothetical protein AMAG_01201 [Allomyces macrogynus ATCC 38327]|eukprot:KNE55294.1 hypothetical protein AMAG_01201 [Allomyces macrogynus ATCC 38327]
MWRARPPTATTAPTTTTTTTPAVAALASDPIQDPPTAPAHHHRRFPSLPRKPKMDQLLLKINGLSTQLNPLTKNIERGFGQVKQFAQERLGTASNLTELPDEYLALEAKTDAIQKLLAAMLKATGHESLVPQAVTETVTDLSRTLRAGVATAVPVVPGLSSILPASVAPSAEPEAPPAPQAPSHTLARAAAASSDALGQEPLGAAVRKFAAAQDVIGNAELALEHEKQAKFVKPVSALLNDRLAAVARSRRNVSTLRLQLDAIKSRFNSATPHRAEGMQVELEKAEDALCDAVEEGTKLMKGVVESPEVMRYISDLVAAQLAFHKQCAHVLSELAPEIDEMQVTQEALYNTAKLS